MLVLAKNLTIFLAAIVILFVGGRSASAGADRETLRQTIWTKISDLEKGKGEGGEDLFVDLLAYGDVLDQLSISRHDREYGEMSVLATGLMNLRHRRPPQSVLANFFLVTKTIEVQPSVNDARLFRLLMREIEYLRRYEPRWLEKEDLNYGLWQVLAKLKGRDFATLSQPALAFLRSTALDEQINMTCRVVAQAIVVSHDRSEKEMIQKLEIAWRVIRGDPHLRVLADIARDALVLAVPERCHEFLSHDGTRTAAEQALHDSIAEFFKGQ